MPMRASLALIATIAGVVLLFNFQTPDITATGPQRSPARRASPASTSGAAGPTPAPTGGASSQAAPTTAAPSAATPAPAPTPTPAATSSGFKSGTFDGSDVTTRYGDVQVRVVISGGRITDVQSVTLPSDRQRSAEISQQAGPLLHDEVLQAQSAQIDQLSGATYTSDGYAQSVQAALDQAHG